MRCFICELKAIEEKPLGDYRHVHCDNCGEYKISGTAIAVFAEYDWAFDRDEAARWVRSEQIKDLIPMIDLDRAEQLV